MRFHRFGTNLSVCQKNLEFQLTKSAGWESGGTLILFSFPHFLSVWWKFIRKSKRNNPTPRLRQTRRGPAAHLIVGVGKGPGWSSVSWLWEKVEILVETRNWNSQPQNEFRATLKYAMSSFRDKSIRLSKNFGIVTNGKRRLGVRRYVNSQCHLGPGACT